MVAVVVTSAIQSSFSESAQTFKLVHENTIELPRGTHRPEVLVTDDGEVVIAVVEPMGKPGEGQVKHRAYRFDSQLRKIGTPFTLTQTQEPWGEPADHRAAMHGDELIVVYQTLNYVKGGTPFRRGGPSEDDATDQSLLLAIFDLEGNELLRQPIVANATNFYVDNFPDHCLLLEGDTLLVSTGTRGGMLTSTLPTVAVREVNLLGNVEAEHRLPVVSNNIQGSIGNSMLRADDNLVMVSGTPMGGVGINLSQIYDDETWTSKRLASFPSDAERHFPTSVLQIEETILVGYISRDKSGDPMKHPYQPRLLMIGSDLEELADIEVGGDGFAHVHPTMARLENKLFFCWSKRIPNGSFWMPQVVVETFLIDRINHDP